MSNREFRLGRRPGLDGVRAIAVLAVLAFHFRDNQGAVPRGGFLGVDIFFVLSGFLITCLLYEEHARDGRIRFGAFYTRRALRLLPALLGMVVAYTVWQALAHQRTNILAVAGSLFYFTNWYCVFGHGDPAGLGHTWSLSIEEQFYILWPAILVVLLRLRGARAAVLFCAAGLAAAPIIRILEWNGPPSERFMYFSFETRADSLLAGCVLALLLEARMLRSVTDRVLSAAAIPAAAFVGACLVLAGQLAPWLNTVGFTGIAIAVAVVLYRVVTRGWLASLVEHWFMQWIGARSYGLYLWHWPIFLVLLHHLGKAHLADPIALPLTFIVAAASYRYVELPFLRLKRRFSEPRERVPEAATIPRTA